MKDVREIDPLERLKEFVALFETQNAAAKALGVKPPHLTDLLYGRRGFSEQVLDKIGCRWAVVKK